MEVGKSKMELENGNRKREVAWHLSATVQAYLMCFPKEEGESEEGREGMIEGMRKGGSDGGREGGREGRRHRGREGVMEGGREGRCHRGREGVRK